MSQSSRDSNEDQDSLFGSPPPSPARGRSPSQETPVTGGETGPIITVPSTGMGRKNVGTIALPGSHMSCAELPADLPASRLSMPHPTSSHGSSTSNITGTLTTGHPPALMSRSHCSRTSSAAASTVSSASSTRKRKTPKSKSSTPVPPPITLPGPNEPTPPNFLRSQSSLLGLAGLVASVRPAQLYTHGLQHPPIQQSRSHSLVRGSTPTHPIVIDDDQATLHIGKHPIGQLQVPPRLDQLDPEALRSNIMSSLTKEKNIFPVLESLIKLFGGEPHLPSTNPPPQLFARPYGHSIFSTHPSSPAPSDSTTANFPVLKRRKLKHVPAGAVDWDVPFPFAAGEGPQAYRDTWAQDRAKQLVTQLLELVHTAAKRAAIKTAKSGGKISKGRTGARDRRSSRSASVETQGGQVTQAIASESPLYTRPSTAVSMDGLSYYLGSLEKPCTTSSPASGSKVVDSESAVEEGSSAIACDYAAFEEWLFQLQQLLPLETGAPTSESDWGIRTSVPPETDLLASMQHATGDEAIDPALLAISPQSGSVPQSQSPTSLIPQILDIPPTIPALGHSPRTSLSSIAEPLTPPSEAATEIPTNAIAHQSSVSVSPPLPPVEKEYPLRVAQRVQAMAPFSLIGPFEPPLVTAAQKGTGLADGSVASPTPSESSQSTPSTDSMSKGALNKQAILERARERRKQLVAEIERAKIEVWETTIENAVLVNFTRGPSLS